ADVEIHCAPFSKEVKVSVDEVRFQQIMMNLFNNAKHALTDVEHPEIAIKVDSDNSYVMIDVADNGTGIPDKEQPFVFERFYRGENKKLEISGFGLGLPFSKMIAQALDGDLLLIKSTWEGTVFRIILPLRLNE